MVYAQSANYSTNYKSAAVFHFRADLYIFVKRNMQHYALSILYVSNSCLIHI